MNAYLIKKMFMNTWLPKMQKLISQNKWAEAKKTLAQEGLMLLPAMVDSHVHFRTPGQTYKEDWQTASKAMINGGISAVIDMPNNSPAVIDGKTLNEKIRIVKNQVKLPVKYFFYLGASSEKTPDPKLKNKVIGLKVFLGSSTGNLLIDKKEDLEKIFKIWTGLLAFHAEAEDLIFKRSIKYKHLNSINKHSIIRNDRVAARAVRQVISLARKYRRPVYICHVSTKKELELIKRAKKQGMIIFAEASPHHLFLNTSDYKQLGTKAKVNPPLRPATDQKALWQAVQDGTIDVIGTDHAPHLLKEKNQRRDKAPSGLPEIETVLPLMLNSVNQKKISLNRLIELMHKNPKRIFKLKNLGRCGAIVDLKKVKTVSRKDLKTKCRWSPYENRVLKGWPVATILDNKIYPIK